jgi:hypothetical protein
MSNWNSPESIEQRLLVQRLFTDPRTSHLPWFAVPNGSNKSISQAKLFKAEGLRKGVPDLIFPFRDKRGKYIGLAIEMKRPDGKGKLSVEQTEFLVKLQDATWQTHVALSADEAWRVIAKYIGFTP